MRQKTNKVPGSILVNNSQGARLMPKGPSI